MKSSEMELNHVLYDTIINNSDHNISREGFRDKQPKTRTR